MTALAVYAPNFYGAFLPNERWAATRYSVTEGFFLAAFVTGAAAAHVTDWLDVGLGLSYVYASFTTRRAVNLAVMGDPSGETRFEPAQFDQDGAADATGTDHAFNLTAGFVVRPHRRVRLGISWQSRTNLEMEGPITVTLSKGGEQFKDCQRTNMVIPTAVRAGFNVDLHAAAPGGAVSAASSWAPTTRSGTTRSSRSSTPR